MANPAKKIARRWRSVKTTSGFRKLVTYLIFVGIATLFWFILALNDNIQDDFDVKLEFTNVPDSVTFITVPPEEIHVAVRDQGASILRRALFVTPKLHINFRDYAKDGKLIYGKSELNAGLKGLFGAGATLVSTSIDNLSLDYTTLPGKRIPVVVSADFSAAVGKVIYGQPSSTPKSVTVYGTRDVLDTITRVFTEKIVRTNLEDSKDLSVRLKNVSGARIEPETVKVHVNVEMLVRKEANVTIKAEHLPAGMDILLFPSTATVEYFIPMSCFNRDDVAPEVSVDVRELQASSKRLPLHLGASPKDMLNIRVLTDSVEYTLVRN